jgi:RNA polymerase sigma-70 factor (ECF subfamily)
MSVTDESLRQQVQNLYVEHHGWLQGWLLSRLRCSHQAADLAQDTFVRVLSRAERREAVPVQEPRAFLTTIAKGLVIDHWRRSVLEQAYLEALASLPEPFTPSLEERHLTLELLERLASMLEGLKLNVRRAFLHSQLDGWTAARIAERMQVSQRTIERYLAEAMYHCYRLRYE